MSAVQINTILRSDVFDGNEHAFSELRASMAAGTFVAFTGAGTSVPDMPTWSGVLNEFLNEARQSGLINETDAVELFQQLASDPLEVASVLEEAFTPVRFRARLGERFSKPNICTETHEMLMTLPFAAFVTLNYDAGLSNAFVRRFRTMPDVVRPEDTFQLAKWTQGAKFNVDRPAILQWHGVVDSPKRMVFTAEDYNEYYSNSERTAFIQDMWRSRQTLAIGFGFTDPFLTRVLQQTLRTYDSDNRHFALIGVKEGASITSLTRRTFSKKYRLTPIFYQVRIDPSSGLEDHSDLLLILESLRADVPDDPSKSAIIADDGSSEASSLNHDLSKKEFEKNLLAAPNGTQLYVEPRLYAPIQGEAYDNELKYAPLSVDDIVRSSRSTVVSAPHEYGLTSLGKRVAYELVRLGHKVYFRDANHLPNYRKKLEEDEAFVRVQNSTNEILILDGVSFQQHERLLKEIIGLQKFSRIIILSFASNFATQVEDSRLNEEFDVVLLSQLERPDIRTLAGQLYGTHDADLISGAVAKTYTDLLDLCIPLTANNVIMYLSVIYKEGDFLPLSRLQIIDRYVRELLKRPSDIYRDSFNVENKIDVISLFVHSIYAKNQISFSRLEWDSFCKAYMDSSLVAFDAEALLGDLKSSRFLLMSQDKFYFKYKMFYAFFLGRYVANRPDELRRFLVEGKHLQVENLVEVISGLSSDNSLLIEKLTENLEKAVGHFRKQYGLEEFDFYDELVWTTSKDEDKALWQSVSERLDAGPATTDEVDKVKTSILAEQRTADQAVVIRDFSEAEEDLSANAKELISALNNAIEINGSLKVRAANAILDSYSIMLQVGIAFAPIIATRKYFIWNGLAFANRLEFGELEKNDIRRRTGAVLSALPGALVVKIAHEMGSKKLGEIYRFVVRKGDLNGFRKLMIYSLILRSKPRDWNMLAEGVVSHTEKQSLYLRYMLSSTMRQFHEEVNTNHDRTLLKRVVAAIQTVRSTNKSTIRKSIITEVVNKLDQLNYFDRSTPDDVDKIEERP